jgi:hypothetical protein
LQQPGAYDSSTRSSREQRESTPKPIGSAGTSVSRNVSFIRNTCRPALESR